MKPDKVAFITGSSNGIGAGIAKLFGEKGYTVYVTYFTDKKAAESVGEGVCASGGKARVLHLDVGDEKSVAKAFETVAKECGKLNVLVNNAAVDFPISIEEGTFKDWKATTRTKIDGCFLCTRAALPLLKKSEHANVIIITSTMGDNPDPTDIAYSVGAAATICFMKAMALSLSKYGIRTNAVSPGETRTKMWQVFGDSDELWEKIAKKNPLGRACTPQDVAQAVAYLVEDPSSFINGTILHVNGGGHLT